MPTYYSLFAVTVFLSSFLLFQVQPLIGKHILPWFGGSSAVWVTALFFFMVALAAGYLYVLGLSYFRPLTQGIVHLVLIGVVTYVTFLHTQTWPSGITPTAQDLTFLAIDPTAAVFFTLLVAVGLPFLLLSSTSSLLQLWYARVSGQDPSSLYAVSNVGSLLGLLSYPFVIEPWLGTYDQGSWWNIGLAFFLGLLCSVLVIAVRATPRVAVEKKLISGSTDSVTGRHFFIWLFVASVPVMALLSGTTFMTTTVAPIPLLWIGPLALYLISFMWSFRTRTTASLPVVHQAVVLLCSLTVLVTVTMGVAPVLATIGLIHLTLYAVFHWCHEYLYEHRPAAEKLPLFYVALSLGGIFGSVVIKISSLYLLTLPIELTLILLAAALFIIYQWYRAVPDWLPPAIKNQAPRYLIALAALFVVYGAFQIYTKEAHATDQARNFFGYKAIVEYTKDDVSLRSLQHGLTNHGLQVIEDGAPKVVPASYYNDESGIGRLFAYWRNADKPLRVAVAGLGTGGLAAHCVPGDTFVFIEIDPQVIALAHKHFTYLEACPGQQVVVADARLAFAQMAKASVGTEKFDLIILDAYADDMMPMHLMTVEATALYKSLLSENGMIATNISSRYLNLLPVASVLAEETGLTARHYFNAKPTAAYSHPSHWVVLAQDEAVFTQTELAEFTPITEPKRVRWTDTYSALLPIVRIW